AGAQGLMQLTPGTWGEMRTRLLNAISDPLNPEDNIKAGMTYQRKIMQIKGCNLEGVIRGYHAGPYATYFGPANDDYYQKVSACYKDWVKPLKA
ncbi:MAG: lytic transglycosylase domain-containing protein, partial [Candidatus Micrarchaeota archaeon]